MKTFAQEIAHQLSLTPGVVQQAAIDLTAAQNETTIINVGDGQRFVIEKLELVCDAAGTVAFWSGTVAAGQRITGDMALAANAEYVFQDYFGQAAAHDFILNRASSVAVRGSVTYRVLS